MRVTGVRTDIVTDDVKSKGYIACCSVTIDYNFRINGIRLMNGSKGYYLLFPADDYNMGLAFPIKNEFRIKVLNCILKKLELNQYE